MNINKFNEFSKNFLIRLSSIIKYIITGLIFIVIGLMVALPIILKNTSFKGDDIVIFNKTIDIISVEGKVNIKMFDNYANTGISYNVYNDYSTNFNKKGLFKKTAIVEINTLFILFELIFLYFIMTNIIKLFIEKEDNEYDLYVNKRSFTINALSFLIFSFIRRFIYRNTIFANFNIDIVVIYLFAIISFIFVYKIFEMDKIDIKKVIQNEKYKKNK